MLDIIAMALVAAALGFVAGGLLGQRVEAAGWRRKSWPDNRDPMHSAGRFYYVVDSEDRMARHLCAREPDHG